MKITQEFKQFETVFVYPKQDDIFPIRIFTVQEELPFAGHLILGTAAIIHTLFYDTQVKQKITLQIRSTGRSLSLLSEKRGQHICVEMNQGKTSIINRQPVQDIQKLCNFLRLNTEDIDASYPIQVVSTGLAYLLIPVKRNIDQAQIIADGFEHYLTSQKAKFAYFFQTDTLECRTWDNSGTYEDIATGSAAGTLIAYLVDRKIYSTHTEISFKQGSFCNRPSIITGRVNQNNEVIIRGNVTFFAAGEILQ